MEPGFKLKSVVNEGKTSAVYTDPKTGKGYDLQYVSSKKRWELDVMKKGASIYSNAITTIKRNTLAEIQEWLDGYKIDSSWTKGLSETAMIEALSASDRKAIAYTMAEQDPSKIKELQDAIGQEFSDNYSSTNRSILVDVKKKGGKWVAITSETESEYNNKKPKKGEREATIGITWNAMFF